MAMGCVTVLLLALGTQDPAALPDEPARNEAEKLVRELFKDDLAKTASADRQALARKLLGQARESRSEPAAQYVLFALSEDLAAGAGDLELVEAVLDEHGKAFQLDLLGRREAILQHLPVKTPDEIRKAASAWLRLASDSLPAGSFDRVEKAAGTAGAQARKIKDAALAARAAAIAKDLSDLRSRYGGLALARQTLAAQPEDGAANALVGRFECLVSGAWESGLPKLSKGSDLALKEIALEELAQPSEALRRVALADAWAGQAEKESGAGRISLLRHAATLYRSAEPGLSGLSKVRVDKRLEEIARAAGAAAEVNLLALIDPKEDTLAGTWTVQGSVMSCGPQTGVIEVPFAPPVEYDLRARLERRSGQQQFLFGIVVEGRQTAVAIDEFDITGLGRIDGLKTLQNETAYKGRVLLVGKESVLLIQVRKGGVALTVDGKSIFKWKGDAQRLSKNPNTAIRRPDILYLTCGISQFDLKELILVPLSGDGRRVR